MKIAYIVAILVVLTVDTFAQPLGQVPTNLNFGSILIHSQLQKEIALKNIGDASLTVYSISVDGPFAVTGNRCQKGVKPGTHCNILITYSPQAAETDAGTLTINDNASNSPQTTSLVGVGTHFQAFYRFHESGAFPNGGLSFDPQGNLYGTTSGDSRSFGTVYELTPNAKETFLYKFGGVGGEYPAAGVIPDAEGNLYGTTSEGGAYMNGTVFKVTPNGSETVLYSFDNNGGPNSNLVADAQGNLYGTTGGTVFELTADGNELLLYSFCSQSGCTDGDDPSGVILDAQGNLYGTTEFGGDIIPSCYNGAGCGTVFKLSPDGTETVLYAFTGGADGAFPFGGVILDAEGNLYGTTGEGGAYMNGTVFKVTPNGTETVLYSFTGQSGDGSSPSMGLTVDAEGNLFGTTYFGGDYNAGTVFELTPIGLEKVLYSFSGKTDGNHPQSRGSLTWDSRGNLWGTATIPAWIKSHYVGVVFEVAP